MRVVIFKNFAASENYGMIYTMMWDFDDPDDWEYLEHVKGIFEPYAAEYAGSHRGTMILNVKSERIEHRILKIIKKYGIKRYFFLDSTFPMIKLLSDMGERNIAVRYSEYEGMDTVRAMAGKIGWVWVDTFTRLPLDCTVYKEMKGLCYRLCLVSPELQGQPEKIEEYRRFLSAEGIAFDAICSKSYNTL